MTGKKCPKYSLVHSKKKATSQATSLPILGSQDGDNDNGSANDSAGEIHFKDPLAVQCSQDVLAVTPISKTERNFIDVKREMPLQLIGTVLYAFHVYVL